MRCQGMVDCLVNQIGIIMLVALANKSPPQASLLEHKAASAAGRLSLRLTMIAIIVLGGKRLRSSWVKQGSIGSRCHQ